MSDRTWFGDSHGVRMFRGDVPLWALDAVVDVRRRMASLTDKTWEHGLYKGAIVSMSIAAVREAVGR